MEDPAMKKLAIGLAVLIVLFIGVLVFVAGSLDAIVEAVIEEVGTETTKTRVDVGGVNISLVDAQGTVNGLSVANPADFSSNKAISLGAIQLKLDVENTTSDLVVIKEIRVDKPTVNYEFGKGGSNFDVIKKNVASAGSSSESAESSGPKLIIDHLYINDGSIAVSSVLTPGEPLSTPLPNIHLKDIGKSSGGASAEEVAKQILTVLTRNAGSAVGKLDLRQLKDVGAVLKDKPADITEGVKDELGGAGDKLKGLFK
jgi:predicted DNA binding protein